MSGETPTPQERASKLQYLFILLFLSLSLVACQTTDQDPESKPGSFLYPKLELNMAPLLVQQLCAKIADTHGLDIENAEPISYVKQIETSIAQLKEKTNIHAETIASMEAYAQLIAKLESEGRLHTVLGSEYLPDTFFEGKTYIQRRGNCAITTLNDSPRSIAEQGGLSFHEGMHAVLLAQKTENKFHLDADEEESLAQYYMDLVTYGARLAGILDLPTAERVVLDGIDMPAITVYLAEHGYQHDHPLFRFLESRLYIKWCNIQLERWKKYDQPDLQKMDRLRGMIISFEQPWQEYVWPDQDVQLMQDLEQKGLVETYFFQALRTNTTGASSTGQ